MCTVIHCVEQVSHVPSQSRACRSSNDSLRHFDPEACIFIGANFNLQLQEITVWLDLTQTYSARTQLFFPPLAKLFFHPWIERFAKQKMVVFFTTKIDHKYLQFCNLSYQISIHLNKITMLLYDRNYLMVKGPVQPGQGSRLHPSQQGNTHRRDGVPLDTNIALLFTSINMYDETKSFKSCGKDDMIHFNHGYILILTPSDDSCDYLRILSKTLYSNVTQQELYFRRYGQR